MATDSSICALAVSRSSPTDIERLSAERSSAFTRSAASVTDTLPASSYRNARRTGSPRGSAAPCHGSAGAPKSSLRITLHPAWSATVSSTASPAAMPRRPFCRVTSSASGTASFDSYGKFFATALQRTASEKPSAAAVFTATARMRVAGSKRQSPASPAMSTTWSAEGIRMRACRTTP